MSERNYSRLNQLFSSTTADLKSPNASIDADAAVELKDWQTANRHSLVCELIRPFEYNIWWQVVTDF
jgi:hypothetical protein